jgi:hypothetical protein
VDLDVAAQAERVRPADRGQRSVTPTHPRDQTAVVEADHQLGA